MAFTTLTVSCGQRLFPRVIFARFNSATLMVRSLALTVFTPLVGKYLDLIGKHYNHTFFIGAAIELAGLTVVPRKFKELGGDRNYQAPLSNPVAESE